MISVPSNLEQMHTEFSNFLTTAHPHQEAAGEPERGDEDPSGVSSV